MCCSGNHKHHHSKTDAQEDRTGKGLLLPMMIICCLLPALGILSLGATGIGGSLQRIMPVLMIVICLGAHFILHGHKNNCCKDDAKNARDNITE